MRWVFFHFQTRLDPAGPHAGAERALIATAQALARRGHEVTVVGRMGADTTAAGVRYRCAGAPEAYDVAAGLARVGAQCDVLVSTLRGDVLEASLVHPGIRRRLLWPNVADVAAVGLPIARLVEVADHVVLVSVDQAAGFAAAGVPRERITVVPNGVDPEIFRPDPAVARAPGRLVFAGALVPDKGVDVLLHAMPAVAALVPGAELVVCGSPGLWERAPFFDPAAVAAELPCVRFRGALAPQAVAAELRQAVLAVVPTPPERWREAMPLASIEAQACGTPVVVTRSGGLPETVRPEETGWVIERATPEDLAAAIVGALRDPARLARMGARAAAWAAATFSWERTAASLEGLGAPAPAVALVTTWRQPCGLARYAERLVAALPPGSVRILAEEAAAIAEGETPAAEVERVWRRGAPLDAVVAAAVRDGVRLVHVNHHGALFGAHLSAALVALRARGVATVVTLHAPNQRDPEIAAIGAAADAILVHGDGARLEVIANGVPPEKVHVVPHGIDPLTTTDAATTRAAMGLAPGEKLVASVGFIQPHKGFDEAIQAVAALRARGLPVQYLVLGGVAPGDGGGAVYRDLCRAEAERLGISDAVTIVDRHLPDAAIAAYLRAADVIVLPYRTSWWEASGAARDALASGRPVVTSAALAFADLGPAVFRTTGAFPLVTAIAVLLATPALAAELVAAAARLAERDAWPRVAERILGMYRTVLADPPVAPVPGSGRVLLVLREQASRTGGGDTVIADTIAAHVDPRRVAIVRQEGGRVLGDVDLVHLFNFSTYVRTRAHAEQAAELGIPYVVSAMYEDWPAFKVAAEAALQRYRARLGLPPTVDLEAYDRLHEREQREMLVANARVAAGARGVVATGAAEEERLRRDFPGIRTRVIPIGLRPRGGGDADAFRAKYGTRDFVLCVGRLEPRKNQLALLEALADDAIDVVLATGGFAYRTDYLEACQALRRRGRTLYLPQLTEAELMGAYRAARLHVLPSWFELPGLVTLEALQAGCAVVASDRGTLRAYLGDAIPYAPPDDPAALRRAIADAGGWDFAAARARVAGFTAARHAEAWTALYEETLAETDHPDGSPLPDRDALRARCAALEHALPLASRDLCAEFDLLGGHPWAATACDPATTYYACLHAIARIERPRRILEIGTAFGMSAAALLKASPGIELFVSLDLGIYGAQLGASESNLDFARARIHRWCARHGVEPERVQFHRANTQPPGRGDNDGLGGDVPRWTEIPALVGRLREGGFDLVFVDGKHTGDGLLNDLTTFWSLLAPGGLLVCDDLHDPAEYAGVFPWVGDTWRSYHAFLEAHGGEIADHHVWGFPHVPPPGRDGARPFGLVRKRPGAVAPARGSALAGAHGLMT